MKRNFLIKGILGCALALGLVNCGGKDKGPDYSNIQQKGVLGTWEPNRTDVNYTGDDSKVESVVYITSDKLINEVTCHTKTKIVVRAEAKIEIKGDQIKVIESRDEQKKDGDSYCTASIKKATVTFELSDNDQMLTLTYKGEATRFYRKK